MGRDVAGFLAGRGYCEEAGMKFTASFEFEAGAKTCAAEPGRFCRFCRIDPQGRGECVLFRVQLFSQDGWLMRADKCLYRSHEGGS